MCGRSPRSKRCSGAEDAKLFAEIYDVTAGGNFEGHNILNRLGAIELRDAETEARLAAMRAKLLARRARRVRPGFDDKVLADWNGLMIAALANAADAFDRAGLARGRGARLRFRLYTDDCRTGGCCTPIAPARRRRRRPPTTTPT